MAWGGALSLGGLVGALLGLLPPPAHAAGIDAHEVLARAALARLPARLERALLRHEDALGAGVEAGVSHLRERDAYSIEPAAHVRALAADAERLTVLEGKMTPFLAFALGRLSVEVAQAARPYGLYRGTYAPPFAAELDRILDAAVIVGERAAPAPPGIDDVDAFLLTSWERASARQAWARADAQKGFPPDCTTVQSARAVADTTADAIAAVWQYLLDAPHAAVDNNQVLAVSLDQVRFGAEHGVWEDVERGLDRLAEQRATVSLTAVNVGPTFFSMHHRGAPCTLYSLALRVDAQGSHLRSVLRACSQTRPAREEATGDSPRVAMRKLSSAETTGIRAFRHRRGHVLLTNRQDEMGEDFVPLNFEPIPTFRPAAVDTAFDLEAVVRFYAGEYGLDSALLKAVMQTESDFDPHVVSSAGARGLMQLMPNTALEMGVTDIFDPTENVGGGAQYLAMMFDLFDGDVPVALAAYNAGPGTVRRYGGIPPYAETQAYVPLVLARAKSFRASGATVTLRGDTPRPDTEYLPEEAKGRAGAVVYLRNGLTMRGVRAVDIAGGVRLEMDTGWIVVPSRNVARVVRAGG